MAHNKQLVSYTSPNSKISEQYRLIRTNLQFSAEQEKTIIITSPSYGEGKTTVAANIAVSMAQQGENVLLVDADLRKPELHAIFEVDNNTGLTSILAGKVAYEVTLQETEIAGLHILPAGPYIHNPAEHLGMSAMKQLIDIIRKQYDFIIFDTPPVLEVTDTNVLANQCDGVVLVLKSNNTDAEAAKEAQRILGFANSKLLGAVLNHK
ncbi:CpsD/CapB family tyrosine-protein kinase [Ectobacillus sp. JY-23]|uniref:CpsD/CapB family tyrosine-protein kinase n=1 Tax=Ectobacillus sp. JY-23 TaxID=2933872 RepID=UPI001FF4D009|nr:CpsD/CapB family tyrosine-protein kinase [Ectobacillus sp. JY-23]UOY92690.1 CpsD/CapB family tyrosine-protein kinase [Ectobacillus sp. JY-23]